MDTRTDTTVPGPVSVGPEMDALGRFYRDVTWKGVIHEGGMGPGTPAMTGVGHSTSQVIQDGRWIAMDSEQDQYLEDGTFVLKWQLHWVSGWDPGHGEYRAVMADNYGHADVYREARGYYEALGVADRIAHREFEGDHAFSAPMRACAYEWLDRWLGSPTATSTRSVTSASA